MTTHPDPHEEQAFGDYLVRCGFISRFEQLCALELRGRHPDSELGHCLAGLGFMPYGQVSELRDQWERDAIGGG